jgi:type IV secretory pathway VirB10-like protein
LCNKCANAHDFSAAIAVIIFIIVVIAILASSKSKNEATNRSQPSSIETPQTPGQNDRTPVTQDSPTRTNVADPLARPVPEVQTESTAVQNETLKPEEADTEK